MTERSALTPEQLDWERLRKLAKYHVKRARLLTTPNRVDVGDALDAIALWTLLGESECLLCGKERDDEREDYNLMDESTWRGPDAGSVLCQRCREGR